MSLVSFWKENKLKEEELGFVKKKKELLSRRSSTLKYVLRVVVHGSMLSIWTMVEKHEGFGGFRGLETRRGEFRGARERERESE